MCDDSAATYTERVKAWLKEHEPTPDQIQGAYTKMLAKLANNPDEQSEDSDACLEILIEAYGGAGGVVDDLLAADEKTASRQRGAVQESCLLDSGPLYDVEATPIAPLAPSEKRAAFLQLKQQLGSRSLGA